MVDPVVRRLRADEVRQARELRLAALGDAPEAFLCSFLDTGLAPLAAGCDRRLRRALTLPDDPSSDAL
jgi:hypothetical protein